MTHMDEPLPPYRVELKNLNSIKAVVEATRYEIRRQAQLLDAGIIPAQETRMWVKA